MKSYHLTSESEENTKILGKKISQVLHRGDIVCLFGDLGSGKTTLVKGMAQGLKIRPATVHSPTFVMMNIYEGKMPLFHWDLYRIKNTKEISSLGFEEFLYDDGISVIEWADKLKTLVPEEHLRVELTHRGINQRSITLKAVGGKYEQVLRQLSKIKRKS